MDLQTYQKGFNDLETSVLYLFKSLNPKYKAELQKRVDAVESHVASMAPWIQVEIDRMVQNAQKALKKDG